MRWFLLALVAGALGGLLPGASAASQAEVANPFTTAASRAAVVHFVPLDSRAKLLLTATVPNVKKWLRNPYEITAVPAPGSGWVNQSRRQINGRAAMADLLARFRRVQGDRLAFLVPVTSSSMYDPDFPAYGFVFGTRGMVPAAVNGKQAIASVATAQMRVFHPERERARLTKMMLRYIGEVICRLPRNSNPKSVLYTPLLSDAELDGMVATLPSRC
jgi:hypothetical protein